MVLIINAMNKIVVSKVICLAYKIEEIKVKELNADIFAHFSNIIVL